jgi:hypothetical protein
MLKDWKIKDGYLYAGSVRVAKMDFAQECTNTFKKDAEKFLVNKLNESPPGPKEWNSCFEPDQDNKIYY